MAVKRKGGMWPPPVYVAEFDDGTVGRASFWSPAGKPFDFESGRRALAQLFARPEDESGLADKDGNPIKIDLAIAREPDVWFHKCGSYDWRTDTVWGGCGTEWRSHDKEWGCPNGCADYLAMHRKVERDYSNGLGPVTLIVYPPRVIVNGWVEHDVPGEPWVRVRDPRFVEFPDVAWHWGETVTAPKPKRKSAAADAKRELAAARAERDLYAAALLDIVTLGAMISKDDLIAIARDACAGKRSTVNHGLCPLDVREAA